MNNLALTEKQKTQIQEEFVKNPDLRHITQIVFEDDSLDGRSKEGRAVRAFLINNNLEFNTTTPQRVEEIDLTTEQREFLMSDNIERGMNALEATRLAFRDREIQPLSQQHRMVMEFLRSYRPEIVDDNDMITSDKWTPLNQYLGLLRKLTIGLVRHLTKYQYKQNKRKCVKGFSTT